jgi:hypothetical protein
MEQGLPYTAGFFLQVRQPSTIPELLPHFGLSPSDFPGMRLPTYPARLESVKRILEVAKREIAGLYGGETLGCPGVYAITFPHYWKHPYDRSDGRTLLKVGCGENVYKRITSMVSKIACPEPWLIARVYRARKGHAEEIEMEFHRRLFAAGHRSPHHDSPETGCEWFLTDVDFLDDVAKELDLAVVGGIDIERRPSPARSLVLVSSRSETKRIR